VTWGYATADALRAHAPHVVFERVEQIAEVVLGPGADRGEQARLRDR
jgi:hypothetical protein